MRKLFLASALVLLASAALPRSTCSIASAQSVSSEVAHPRRARALFLMSGEAPVVLVASDRAWLPGAPSEPPLSICAGERCRPVRAIEACAPPRCPGAGTMFTTEGAVASASDYPTGRAEFDREREALIADPVLAQYASSFSNHPDPPPEPARWQRHDEEARWEASLAVGPSLLADADIGTADIVFGAGVRLLLDWGGGDDGDFLGIALGSSLGVDARVHVMPGIGGQVADDFAVAIGIAPVLSYSPPSESVRVPSVWSFLIPEFGAILRGDRAPAFYFAYDAPIAFLLDEHVAVEARASVMLVDDWVDGDDLEAIFGLSAALIVR